MIKLLLIFIVHFTEEKKIIERIKYFEKQLT